MGQIRRIVGLIALGAAMGVGGMAAAQPPAGLPPVAPILAETGPARPVPAWTALCERDPPECAVDAGETEAIRLTRAVWQTIRAVNARVNAAVEPLTDERHWGVADLWGLPEDGFGDCEDYQLQKRRLLVAAGLPRRALLMTVVVDEKGEGHAVLLVRTDRGDFVLDNKTAAVRPWDETGYVFVKRESASGAWASLGGVASPATTANR
jgi:predicted transglutaminase-like cysteine proteinase